MTRWRLKKGADMRLRQGHPWVFASELAHSAREVEPGQIVALYDHGERFLAYGYAHPSSQICFRKLSGKASEQNVLSIDFLIDRLNLAREIRKGAGWTNFSHRWINAEADGLPGLIVDAFCLRSQEWLIVVQISTAGIERVINGIVEALLKFQAELGTLHVLISPTSQSRRLEGLPLGERQLVYGELKNLSDLQIGLVNGLSLHSDFVGGQKTGFFLDQQWNTRLLTEILKGEWKIKESEKLKVLDICCYVGQWSSQAAKLAHDLKREVDVTLVDVSTEALNFASRNVSAYSSGIDIRSGDALEVLADLPENEFDLVICDPPAFVKKKADLEAGLRAYTKLNRDAARRVKPGGIFVSSSCSGRVNREDWRQVMVQSLQKAGRMFRQIVAGGHGPDHPLRPEFPEGEYLKCLIGRIDLPF